MVKRLINAVIYCAIVLVVAWLLTVLLSLLPIPAVATLGTVIWVLAVLICIIVVLRIFADAIPDAP